MTTSISQTSWYQQTAWALENDQLRVVLVPEMGGKIVSLLDKTNQQEWLIDPADRPFRPAPYGAVFTDQDMSGWDEMFPTIVECAFPLDGPYKGTHLPDHGEIWTLPWQVSNQTDETLALTVQGKALPYQLTRTVKLTEPGTVQLHYQLKNKGKYTFPYMWAAHPQFACEAGTSIILPPTVSQVCNVMPTETGWGTPETIVGWPDAQMADGTPLDISKVGAPDLKRARKFFTLPDAHISWMALQQPTQNWLRMAWDSQAVPYFGLWLDEGLLNHKTVITPEPITGFYDSLVIAWEKQLVKVVPAGGTVSWTLTVQLSTGDLFPSKSQG